MTDEELGTAINYILIYPAGSVTGTLADMTKFAQSFVDEECPLFEKQETMGLMLSASDYYGDSEIPKNCHGLWCTEYAVRVMGHNGNTMGGSAQLMFDRESQIGVVVLTNQQYETLFCYGIPEMILPAVGWIVTGQVTAFALGAFLFMLRLEIKSITLAQIFAVLSGCIVLAGMLVSLLTAVATFKAAVTTKGMNIVNRLKYLGYVLCNLYVVGFLGYFRLLDFWS